MKRLQRQRKPDIFLNYLLSYKNVVVGVLHIKKSTFTLYEFQSDPLSITKYKDLTDILHGNQLTIIEDFISFLQLNCSLTGRLSLG